MKLKLKMPETKSLQWKLLSRFILILLFLLLIMETYQYLTMRQYLYKSKEQVLESRIHNVDVSALQNIQSPDAVVHKSSELINKMIDFNITIAIIDGAGNQVAGATKPGDITQHGGTDNYENMGKVGGSYPIPIPRLSKNDYISLLHQKGDLEGYRLIKDENNDLQLVIWRKVGILDSPSGLVQLSLSAKPVQSILLQQMYIYIGASILVLIIGVILGVAVFKYTLKPLYNVTETVEQINVKQLDVRLPSNTGQLEIDKLSGAFNNMLERIETSFQKEQAIKEKLRQFVSDASHELRTPLTSIHGFVEVLLRGAAKNEKQLDSALNSILNESERLTKLVNDLLLLTKLDRQADMDFAPENMNDIINEVYPQLQILSGERKIELQLEDNIFVNVNRNQIKQVILNLVQNAVRHTDEKNGVITVSTDSINKFQNNLAVLKISDNGTGIPKEHLDQIFDRFFRSESHRSRKHGGYGLGLSIVKSIIDAHDGEIKVSSELNKGTSFAIYLNQLNQDGNT